MTYVAWAALYEGRSDDIYFGLLIPRAMEAIIAAHGTRNVSVPLQPALVMQRGSAVQVGQEACGNRQAFHIMFIHADTGGRAQAGDIDDRSSAYCAAMQQICAWPPTRCVTIQPRHETEAWLLAVPAGGPRKLSWTPLAIAAPRKRSACRPMHRKRNG
jgi:hypothetical protein